MNIVDELVRFSADSLRVFGPELGRQYVDRCLTLWSASYGDGVAAQVRSKLNKMKANYQGNRPLQAKGE